MTLEQSLQKLKEKIEGKLPKEFVEIMHEATADLKASGIEINILKVGDKAPKFSLKNQNEEIVSSEDLLKEGNVMLTFYRGIWCPYCNLDLSNLKRYKSNFEEENIKVLGVSPQSTKFNKQIVEQQRLSFDVLNDEGNNLASQFGLKWTMVNPLKSLYKNDFKINLVDYNGDDTWTLPVPARFVINQEGIITYAEYSVDYTKRPNPEVIFEALKTT
ncbi:peroxiredoxin-like family protein [Tenacibaculum xiamenense]|uniref:peroxiredoxin-like family protein n=1 Tax=Tenacibaculum xiamenense TaxID=1261553 RepID=UPI0038960CBD